VVVARGNLEQKSFKNGRKRASLLVAGPPKGRKLRGKKHIKIPAPGGFKKRKKKKKPGVNFFGPWTPNRKGNLKKRALPAPIIQKALNPKRKPLFFRGPSKNA